MSGAPPPPPPPARPMSNTDIFEILRLGHGEDPLDLECLQWVLEDPQQPGELQIHQSAHGVRTTARPIISGALPSVVTTSLTGARVHTTEVVVGGPSRMASAPAPTTQHSLLQLKREERALSTSVEDAYTPAATALATVGAGGAGPSSLFHMSSLANNAAASQTAAAAAAAVAALACSMQQQPQSPSGGALEDQAAQSSQRNNLARAGSGYRRSSSGSKAHAAAAAAAAAAALSGLQDLGEVSEGGGMNAPPAKKKRTRNAEQMEQNRQAQQKYRERKKAEHEQLQRALEDMAAQLAVTKALEAQAVLLRNQNSALSTTVDEQAVRLNELNGRVQAAEADLQEAQRQAAEAAALVATQQQLILEQHGKMQEQEQVMSELKSRLQDRMDQAFNGHDKRAVCQRLVTAVRKSIEGARDVAGLQESLAQLPDSVVEDICRSLLHEVKLMGPDLEAAFQALGGAPSHCAAQATNCY